MEGKKTTLYESISSIESKIITYRSAFGALPQAQTEVKTKKATTIAQSS